MATVLAAACASSMAPYSHLLSQSAKQHCSFYRLHVSYFLFFSLVGSLSLWLGPKTDSHRIDFIDALYNAVSALTVTGLASVEMHRLTVSDQVTLLILMILGSQVFTSVLPLFFRRFRARPVSSSVVIIDPTPSPTPSVGSELITRRRRELPGVRRVLSMPQLRRLSFFNASERDFTSGSPSRKHREEVVEHKIKIAMLDSALRSRRSLEAGISVPPDAEVNKGTEEIEKEALRTLSWVVVSYFVFAQLMGFTITELIFQGSPQDARVLKQMHINQAFFNFFLTVSSFANAGFVLLDLNLVPFQRSALLLICINVLILIGNTMVAPMLRVIIWLLFQSASGRKKRVYNYLLQNPRRCYTHLFPHNETLWLVVTVAAFNAAQMLCICALDWNSQAFAGLGTGFKLVDSLFQSITTRNAGMNVVNIAGFSAPTLLLSACMMYVAVYPVYVTRQRSKELIPQGVDNSSDEHIERDIFVQSRRLLARDSVYLSVAMFFICVAERHSIQDDPLNFSVFNLLFEAISGYGNVGLSLGYNCSLRPATTSGEAPCVDVPYSLSGKWNVVAKLILILVMLLGRHRGIPDSLDWAISPPPPLSQMSHSVLPAKPYLNESAPLSPSASSWERDVGISRSSISAQ